MKKTLSIALFYALATLFFATNASAIDLDKIRFGVRGNIGQASSGVGIGDEMNMGTTLGLGGFALIPVWGIYFVPEISLQYRQPVNDLTGQGENGYFNSLFLKEMGMDIPLLFRFRYREENLIYLGAGPLLGVVFTSYYDDYEEVLNGKRERIDYGLAFELGFRINDNFSIDIRGLASFASLGVSEYLGVDGKSSLTQGQIGVNYTF